MSRSHAPPPTHNTERIRNNRGKKLLRLGNRRSARRRPEKLLESEKEPRQEKQRELKRRPKPEREAKPGSQRELKRPPKPESQKFSISSCQVNRIRNPRLVQTSSKTTESKVAKTGKVQTIQPFESIHRNGTTETGGTAVINPSF